ncbi:protein NUCLEAR FUSION DEFECTIVE 4-like [Cornus florida]|uniref:protein NUCLEAR FUSION DEFECTIVE 4-like n=1 Tax=Cornus florida TaxID=4283 RepID=UPI002898A538|nr:protein NUCLEAR FUSION DEFECTIVE 4-like [Cornus florida]
MWLSPTSPAGEWLGFVSAVWVQSVSGNTYSSSKYSQALESIMNLTQLQLNNLSVAKDVGIAFGLLAGISSHRLPTPALLLIGSIAGFIGYGGQWLVISATIQSPPYWLMCIFMCLGGNSGTWMNTAVLVTCFRNFRNHRGPVAGILKGYLGLSSAIFTDFCTALFSDSDYTYLLMLAIVPFVVCFTGIIFLREVPPSSTTGETEETRYLVVFNVVAVAVAVYLLAFDLSGTHGEAFSLAFAVTLLILLASPLLIPLYVALSSSNKSTSTSSSYIESDVTSPLLAASEEESNRDTVVEVERRRRAVIGEDHTALEALAAIDFWVLFVSFLCGVGPAITVTNNLGRMAVAFGYTDDSIFVSLFSIGGFFGRISSGWVSEFFIK